ncbi:hypothetical protein FA421_26730 [Pseudomonas aeruginosa]|nr:hypothetical protein [Pseudomonas aeruginosa]
MGSSMTIHGVGFSTRSGAGNNDKTTAAGKGILLAMCHLQAVLPTGFGIGSTLHSDSTQSGHASVPSTQESIAALGLIGSTHFILRKPLLFMIHSLKTGPLDRF